MASILADLRRVEDLVRAWGEQLPVVDAEEFVASARLRRQAGEAGRRVVRLYRWVAPLAAAAAVALIVTGLVVMRSGSPAGSDTGAAVAEGERTEAVVVEPMPSEARSEAVVIVSFSRGAAPAEDAPDEPRPRLMVTSGAMVSAEEAAASAEFPFF